jgi:hypothetical protein
MYVCHTQKFLLSDINTSICGIIHIHLLAFANLENMYVFMYVCMHVCMDHVHLLSFANLENMYVFMYVCMHVCMDRVHLLVFANLENMYVCMYVCVGCMYVCGSCAPTVMIYLPLQIGKRLARQYLHSKPYRFAKLVRAGSSSLHFQAQRAGLLRARTWPWKPH